jgi:hypothetical protein
VKDDAKFEHQESSNLLLVSLILSRLEFLEDDGIFDLVHIVTKCGMRLATGGCNVLMTFLLGLDLSPSTGFEIIVLQKDRREIASIRVSVADRSATGGNELFDALIVLLTVFGFDISLRGKIHQENDHDRDEDDSRRPGVYCPPSSHANTGLRTRTSKIQWRIMFYYSMIDLPNLTVCRIKKMNERRGNDDASTKVSRE